MLKPPGKDENISCPLVKWIPFNTKKKEEKKLSQTEVDVTQPHQEGSPFGKPPGSWKDPTATPAPAALGQISGRSWAPLAPQLGGELRSGGRGGGSDLG